MDWTIVIIILGGISLNITITVYIFLCVLGGCKKIYSPEIFFDEIKRNGEGIIIFPCRWEYHNLIDRYIKIICKKDHIKEQIVKRVISVKHYSDLNKYIMSQGISNIRPQFLSSEEGRKRYSDIKYKDKTLLDDANIAAHGGISVITVSY